MDTQSNNDRNTRSSSERSGSTTAPRATAPRLGSAALLSSLALALFAPAARADDAIFTLPVWSTTGGEGDLFAPPLVIALLSSGAGDTALALEAPPLVLARLSDGSGGDAGPVIPDSLELPRVVRARGVAPRDGVLVGFGGVQQPVRADVVLRLHEYFAVGGSAGGIPSQMGSAMLSLAGVQNGTLSSLSFDGSLLFFPARDSFFLGVSAGSMSLSASSSNRDGFVAVEAHELYVTPRFGWFATWDSGFTFGFDVGMQLPLSTSVVATGTTATVATNAEGLARTIVEMPMPTISIRLGWML